MILGIPKRALIIVAVLVGIGLIYLTDANRQVSSGATGNTAPGACKVSVTADVLNVRAAPDADAEVVDKVRQNQQTDAQTEVQGGFRKLGDNRWASAEFLKPVNGAQCG